MKLRKKLKICFISTNPTFLGGGTMYLYNLIEYLKKMKSDIEEITWIYKGKEDKKYKKDQINFVEIKAQGPYPLEEFVFNFKILKFLKKNNYDIINCHLEGLWMNFYKKKNNQKIIQTFHGTSYYFNKCHLERFNLFKKILVSPILLFNYFMAKPPMKKVDKIICVAEHVKKEIEKLYGKRKGMVFIRTGVDLQKFKKYEKRKARKKLELEADKIYGLYVGRGGYWRKGLDRTIEISKKLYSQNKKYRLIVIGADKSKVKHLLGEKFVIYVENGKRETLPYYYNSSDIFFCMSRYEGGAPTLVTSEAMASGCLVVCAKSAEQEIILDKMNGLIIDEFKERDAKKILDILGDKKKKEKIIKNSIRTIKEISLEKWGEKYSEVLLK
jgi:glycosyltransferase involved in cell wall biosynthesis